MTYAELKGHIEDLKKKSKNAEKNEAEKAKVKESNERAIKEFNEKMSYD